MSIKQRVHTENSNVQQGQTTIMEDTAATMEHATILMGGPTSPDIARIKLKIKRK